jgi:hypothetical protein
MPPISRKLGKLAAKHDPRTLMLAAILTAATLPAAPPTCDYSAKVGDSWGMMKNDTLGDCAIAGPGHLIMMRTANAGTEFVPTDAQIVKAYSAVSGYNPKTGANDNGCVLLDVMKYWRTSGIAGHKIGAFAAVEPTNQLQMKTALWLFEGLVLGFQLPASVENATVWDVPNGGLKGKGKPGSWGGHCVAGSTYGPITRTTVVGYDLDGLLVISWGQLIRVTWAFIAAYCDEAYAIVSTDMLLPTGVCPAGFNQAALNSYLASISKAA